MTSVVCGDNVHGSVTSPVCEDTLHGNVAILCTRM